jgi:hypothetical protein
MVITLVGAAFATIASAAKGDDFYYVMIFGSQSKPKLLQYTHTWATFIRAVGDSPDANHYAVYQHTISWLPQSLDVRTWSLLPLPNSGGRLPGSRIRHDVGTVPDPLVGLRAFSRGEDSR